MAHSHFFLAIITQPQHDQIIHSQPRNERNIKRTVEHCSRNERTQTWSQKRLTLTQIKITHSPRHYCSQLNREFD